MTASLTAGYLSKRKTPLNSVERKDDVYKKWTNLYEKISMQTNLINWNLFVQESPFVSHSNNLLKLPYNKQTPSRSSISAHCQNRDNNK